MSAETDIQFEVWQDGDMVAAADDIPNAQHYMTMYGQDGPVEAKTAVTVRTPGFAVRTPAPGGEAVTEEDRQHIDQLPFALAMKVYRSLSKASAPVVPVGVSREDDAWSLAMGIPAFNDLPAQFQQDIHAAILAALRPTDTGANHD